MNNLVSGTLVIKSPLTHIWSKYPQTMILIDSTNLIVECHYFTRLTLHRKSLGTGLKIYFQNSIRIQKMLFVFLTCARGSHVRTGQKMLFALLISNHAQMFNRCHSHYAISFTWRTHYDPSAFVYKYLTMCLTKDTQTHYFTYVMIFNVHIEVSMFYDDRRWCIYRFFLRNFALPVKIATCAKWILSAIFNKSFGHCWEIFGQNGITRNHVTADKNNNICNRKHCNNSISQNIQS